MGRPVSQHLAAAGPPADGGGWPWEGLTEAVGLPDGLTIALVTAILACDKPATSRGWFVVVPAATLLTRGVPPALKIATVGGEDDANDELTVTGHCNREVWSVKGAIFDTFFPR